MRIYRHFETLPDDARGAAIAIGNFDGVHPGHQAVIGEAGRIARNNDIPWAVLTFEPHPRAIFRPNSEPFRLTPFRAKAHRLEELGVDAMIVQRFDRAFSERPAEDFVRDVLVDGFGAAHIVAGYDFVFGHERRGTCELLLSMGQEQGFGFTAVSAAEDNDGDIYASTLIRKHLMDADPVGAARILGRPFAIEGRVAHGDGRGGPMGFPTANIHLGPTLRPALGIYAVRVGISRSDGTEWHQGAASLGIRPTFGGTDVVLEVYLLDFEGDLYGQHLSVVLIEYLRPEKKFDGTDPLKAQIALDVVQTLKILANQNA